MFLDSSAIPWWEKLGALKVGACEAQGFVPLMACTKPMVHHPYQNGRFFLTRLRASVAADKPTEASSN